MQSKVPGNQAGRSAGKGMMMMNDSLCRLVEEGKVEPDEAYGKSVDRDDLVSRFRKKGLPLPSAVREKEAAEAAAARSADRKGRR